MQQQTNIASSSLSRTKTTAVAPHVQTQEEQRKEIRIQELIRNLGVDNYQQLPLIFQQNAAFLVFETQLQAEIYNARCHDSGEHASEEKAKMFKEEFNRINSKKTPLNLNLYSMRIGVNCIMTISNLLQSKNYELLDISDNAISDYGMHAIKSIITNTKIRHLNLASNMISESGLEMIVDELSKSTRLLSIDLGVRDGSIRKNAFGVDGAKCIAAVILQNRVLEVIKLQDNDIGITGGEIIGTALKQNKNLKHLAVNENDLQTAGAEFILNSASNLEVLELGKNYIKASIGPTLLQFLKQNVQLLKLNLEYNELLIAGVHHLVQGLESNQTLQSLSLQGNGIRDEGMELLSSILGQHTCAIQELDVSLNEITVEGMVTFSQIFCYSKLKNVNLNKNLLGDETLYLLADNSNDWSKLEKIDLSSCRISDGGLIRFLEKITNFEKLKVIRATDNFVSEKAQKILLELLEQSSSLVDLTLKGNRLSLSCISRIKRLLSQNAKQLEEQEPNKIKAEIFQLKYEQRKVNAVQNQLQEHQSEINKLEQQKIKLIQEIDKFKNAQHQKRQNLNEKIADQHSLIQKQQILIKERNIKFEQEKQEQQTQLDALQKEFEVAEKQQITLQGDLANIIKEIQTLEGDMKSQLSNLDSQIEQQKKRKEEFDLKTEELRNEFNTLMKQHQELQNEQEQAEQNKSQ